MNDAIKYQNDDSARDGVYTESQEYISDTIKELMDENGYSINDIVVAGGADYLKDLSNSLDGYDVSDFNIDKSNMTPDLINIISSAYENASPEERDSNSLLGQLYAQAKDFVVSQSTNPSLYEAYASQMGNIDSGFDNNQQMTLSEMLNDVDRFNQVLAIDPHFYDKYVTPITTKDGKVVYTISDAQRAQMIADENKLLGDNRNIVEDSDYTMTNPDALTGKESDSFFEKFGKSAESLAFVTDGGWKEYNELNKEYLDCRELCNQFNEQGYVIYNGKRYDENNAQSFIDAMNKKVDDIQKQKNEIEQTESFNAAAMATAGELGWEATKFGLSFFSGGLATIAVTSIDGAITFHDSIADGSSLGEAAINAGFNMTGNVIGNLVTDNLGNYMFRDSSIVFNGNKIPASAKLSLKNFDKWLQGEGLNLPDNYVDALWSKISFDLGNQIQSGVEEIGDKITSES